MEKYFIFLFLLVGHIAIYSQDYLDKTPARFFDDLINNNDKIEDYISKNKVNRSFYIDTFKKDTLNVKLYNKESKITEEIHYSNGKRYDKWIYEYSDKTKTLSIYEYEENKTLKKIPNEVWTFEYEKNNLIFQKIKYKSGNELSFKYKYDENKNRILRENYTNQKLTTSFIYKYQNNLLTEDNMRHHSLANGKIERESMTKYFYDNNKYCTKIEHSSGIYKGLYEFKYKDNKLVEEIYDSYDNYAGNIKYSYEKKLLTNIFQTVKDKGENETKISYDSLNRISKTESYNNGGLVFRYFFSRNNKTKQVREYFYDKDNFWVKMLIRENDVLISSFEYSFEYY